MARTNKKIKKKIQNKRIDKNLPWMKIVSLVLLGLVMLGVAFMLGRESLSILSRAASRKVPSRQDALTECRNMFASRLTAEDKNSYNLYTKNFNDSFVVPVHREWWNVPAKTCESDGYTNYFGTVNKIEGGQWKDDLCCVRTKGVGILTMNLADAMGSYAHICYKNNTFTSKCSEAAAPPPSLSTTEQLNRVKQGGPVPLSARSECPNNTRKNNAMGCFTPDRLPYGKNPGTVNQYCQLIYSSFVGNYNGKEIQTCVTSSNKYPGQGQFGICCGLP